MNLYFSTGLILTAIYTNSSDDYWGTMLIGVVYLFGGLYKIIKE
jgi:hypothetical protein